METHNNKARSSKQWSSPEVTGCSDDLGKVPPQAVDLEAAALGAALLERSAVDTLRAMLPPEAFYRSENRLIFEAICRLDSVGKPADVYTVTNELRNSGQLEAVGGTKQLVSQTLAVGSASNVEHHARIIFQKYLQREVIAAGHRMVSLGYDDAQDVQDIVAAADRLVGEVSAKMAGGTPCPTYADVVVQAVDDALARDSVARRGGITGVPTGLVDLDRSTNGWQPGNLIILAGRPGMGKTAMMLHFARSAAVHDVPAAIFSLEMPAGQLASRNVLGEADGVSAAHFYNGFLTDGERLELERAMEREMKKRLYMEYASGMSMGQIRAKARALHKQGKCGLLLIDYLQLCRESGERGRSREQEVSAMSVEAKRTAMELGIPVILLSQLSREVEKRGGDHRPHLSDLRDSGGIEQDADMVAFVYRPAKYFKEYSDENGKPYGDNYGELIIEKHRSGKTGTVAWRHNESLTRIFDDLPPEGLPPQPHNLPANTNFYESGKEQQSDPF